MELEIKLNVLPAIEGGPAMLFTKLTMVPKLAGHPVGNITKNEMVDFYYDTPDGKLREAGAGLRLRVKNGLPFVTLKINQYRDGALTAREEFEEPLSQERLDWVLSQVKHIIGEVSVKAEDFASGKPGNGLEMVTSIGTARFEREIGSLATLTLDMVEYPNLALQPYFDIEVESKVGKAGEWLLRQVETELYQIAGGDLAPAKMNKLERGLKLKEKAQAKAK